MDAKITPALQIDNKKNLSAEEFQKQLYSWLESRGLLCELRAYFRSNMIEVLKNTALGSSISCNLKQTTSPKMQAMNLLIAEYLIYSQHHFSLCVFCTEVSLSNILQNINTERTAFKFSEKEVYDILEAMGILRHNKQAQKIYKSYCDFDDPLIMYFLPSNSLVISISCEPVQSLEEIGVNCESVRENIEKILTNSNMSPHEQSLLKYYIKLFSDKENEKHTVTLHNLKEQYKSELRKYKTKLTDIQKSFDVERKKFQNEIILMRRDLENILIQNKLIKYNMVSNLTEQMQQTEPATVKETTSQHIHITDRSTQYVEEKPKPPTKSDKEQQTLTNTSLEAAVLKHVVQQLEKENTTLRSDNFNYCEQIDELANRASVLMTELNISQQNVVRLNNILQNSPSIFTPTQSVIQHQRIPHFIGAGEESLGAVKHNLPPINYRNLTGVKKSNKKIVSSSENSSGSSSPTDDLLREAKKKLKNLELESEDIDRRIRTFTDRYDFNTRLNQIKMGEADRTHFKFNIVPSEPTSSKIFEFGSSIIGKDSNTDTEITSGESQISLSHASISSNEAKQSQGQAAD